MELFSIVYQLHIPLNLWFLKLDLFDQLERVGFGSVHYTDQQLSLFYNLRVSVTNVGRWGFCAQNSRPYTCYSRIDPSLTWLLQFNTLDIYKFNNNTVCLMRCKNLWDHCRALSKACTWLVCFSTSADRALLNELWLESTSLSVCSPFTIISRSFGVRTVRNMTSSRCGCSVCALSRSSASESSSRASNKSRACSVRGCSGVFLMTTMGLSHSVSWLAV